MDIYAALGVKEVWQYTKRDGLQIYRLAALQQYVHSPLSLVFCQVSSELLNDWLNQRRSQSENQVIREVRAWARSQPQTSA